MKKVFLLLPLALTVACNTSSNPEAEAASKEKEMEATHEAHDHSDMKAEKENQVPAVPAGARVFFANLEDGDTVQSPVAVAFGIEGMQVEPAGEVHEGKGHHHVIINGAAVPTGGVVPADSVNIHYGKGQVADTLELPAGTHSLTLQFADGYHRSYGEQMSNTINLTVLAPTE